MNDPLLISRTEGARALGIGIRTLDGMIRRGELSICRIGRRVLIERSELEKFARGEQRTPSPGNVSVSPKADSS